MSASVPRRVLPLIVFAQFACTSPWFAVNAVMPDLPRELGWPAAAVGTLTSAVQAGFIAGTLLFALLAVSDRFAPRRVFLACALAGAACTLLALGSVRQYGALLLWRALTGFFLAGIYPVGMKLAAQWYERGLGAALGWLIAALVLGSASPHLLRGLGTDLPWTHAMLGVAALTAGGGVVLFAFVPDAPARPAGPVTLHWHALAAVWTDRRLRASVFGYFGHMWELYTMWVLVPAILASRIGGAMQSYAAFGVLGAGAVGCAGGGLLARRFGSARVAQAQLAASGLCCFAAPWLLRAPASVFWLWLLVWGITVSGDSPQFSALTAANALRSAVGSVLTLVNSIGFAISIVSIQLFVTLSEHWPLSSLLPWLGLGPLLGLLALRPLLRADG